MVVSASYELQSFFAAVLFGFFSGILYDFSKSVGKCLGNKFFADALLWAALIGVGTSVWYFVCDGVLRAYMIFGAFLSWTVYFLVLSRRITQVFDFAMKKICCFFNIILKLLLTPIKFLVKIVGVYIKAVNTKFFEKVEDENEEKKTCI